tara:strand:+ start:1724 stop:2323 length:600 start_codon:yes stop_codon:yes gene_type:complete
MPFDYLSNDLIEYIFILCIHDYNGNLFNLHKKLEYLLIINKNCEKIAKNLISLKFYELKSLYIDSFSLPKNILNIFDNNHISIYNLPFLKFSDSFLGFTDCIDNIKKKDVKSKIMIGLDYYRRPFFTFKLNYKNIKTKKEIYKITILYQRYKYNNEDWILESYYNDNFHTLESLNNNLNDLKNLIHNKSLKYKNYLITL